MNNYNIFSQKFLIIILLNILLSTQQYIISFGYQLLIKSAAIGRTSGNIIFDNIFNDILITFSIIFFYIFPFLITKIIKPAKILKLKIFLYLQ